MLTLSAALLPLRRRVLQEVGSRALPILLGVLQEDAPEDVEIAKAVVETLSLLCEVEEVDGRVSSRDNTCGGGEQGSLARADAVPTL